MSDDVVRRRKNNGTKKEQKSTDAKRETEDVWMDDERDRMRN